MEAEARVVVELTSDVRALRADVESAVRAGERDFSERDLDGALLAGANLDGTSFVRASLKGVDMSHASLHEANLEDADLRQANLSDSALEHANLHRVMAAGCAFVGARLGKARLVDGRFQSASFCGANLSQADISAADCSSADFTGANAKEATFARAKLRAATFACARLEEANFKDADLRGARFEDANLSCADLSGAELSGACFARANLSGARLSGGELPYSAEQQNLAALADQDRSLLFSLIGLCTYVLVSAATTTDAQLALNRALVKLPVIDAELPLQLFFVGSAVTVFLTGYYLSLEQSRLIRALGALPLVFPDSGKLADRAHPWFVVVALASWFGRFRSQRAPGVSAEEPPAFASTLGARLLELPVFALIWGLVPFTIGALLLRFMVSQRNPESYLLWALFAVSVVLNFTSFLHARRTRGQQNGKGVLVASVCLGVVLLATLPGVLMGLHDFHVNAPRVALSTSSDGRIEGADLERAPLVRADLRMARLEQAVLRRARLDNAQLGNANLTAARAEFATLEGADLTAADLANVVFWNAHLADAKLARVRAQHADLRYADLRRVDARGADFRFALAEKARFDEANLVEAQLVDLKAPHVSFEGADLDGANLSGAVLLGAKLRGAHLNGTLLEGADLTHADLTGTDGLSPRQLCATHGFREALLPGDSAADSGPPFRIDEPGPLRLAAEKYCSRAEPGAR